MEYQSVGNRCAVDLSMLELPVSDDEALALLTSNGFKVLSVDPVGLARTCIGTSRYRLSARPSEAPGVINCSSLTKWLYAQRGIWLPKRAIQQRKMGIDVPHSNISAGDLVFASGRLVSLFDRSGDEVGHVGIATNDDTIIWSTNKPACAETSFDEFVLGRKFRGVRRYIPQNHNVITLETPSEMDVETSDDIRWIVLRLISKRSSQ